MKKNLRSLLETDVLTEARCLVDMNDYDLVIASGMKKDLLHRKSAQMSGAWHTASVSQIRIPMGDSDLTGVRYLTFSLFSVGGEGGRFRLFFDNDPSGAGENGYGVTLSVVRDGWNAYRLELPYLQGFGTPAGWDHIGAIRLDSFVPGNPEKKAVLSFDSLLVHKSAPAPLFAGMPELKGAVALAKGGNYALTDRHRVINSPDGADAKPFEKGGVLWIPMAPVTAGIARSAVVDTLADTLSFTYRRKKYVFSAKVDYLTEDGEKIHLGFRPESRNGSLFLPIEFVRDFFRWRQIYTDPLGLIVLSNRRGVFRNPRDAEWIRTLVADMTLTRPDGERVFNDLHRTLPTPSRLRILAGAETFMEIRRRAKTDPTLKAYVADWKKQATDAVGVDALIRYAFLYRITGDKKFAATALDLCKITVAGDWNASDAAQTGKTAFAVSVSYDWCRQVWSEADKAMVERALLRQGLRVGLEYYNGKRKMWREGGVTSAVFNTGMLAAALVMADLYPTTVRELLDRVLSNIEPCFAAFSPDGGRPEGVSAWEETFSALSYFVSMLTYACGSDYGFAALPGFSASAWFAYRSEPSFAGRADAAWSFRYARQNGDRALAKFRRKELEAGICKVSLADILYFIPTDEKSTDAPRIDAVYRGAGLAAMRSSWEQGAVFVSLHGGVNGTAHTAPDAGRVLLDVAGVRFLTDLNDCPSAPASAKEHSLGQNTFTVSPEGNPTADQVATATAPLVAMRCAAERAYAVVDMTATSPMLAHAERGVLLCEDRSVVVIRDELTSKMPAVYRAGLHTDATVTVAANGKTATLQKDGKTLVCRLSGASAARFDTEAVAGTDVTRLIVKVPFESRLRLSVACRLLPEGESSTARFGETESIRAWGK